MPRGCGPCNLCCKLLGVPDIGKPPLMLCQWTGIHGGCSRQAEKGSDPSLAACAQFECVWLQSQKREVPFARWSRPDLSHVVLGPRNPEDDTVLFIHVDPDYPGAWRGSEIEAFIVESIQAGGKIEVIVGEKRIGMLELVAQLGIPTGQPA